MHNRNPPHHTSSQSQPIQREQPLNLWSWAEPNTKEQRTSTNHDPGATQRRVKRKHTFTASPSKKLALWIRAPHVHFKEKCWVLALGCVCVRVLARPSRAGCFGSFDAPPGSPKVWILNRPKRSQFHTKLGFISCASAFLSPRTEDANGEGGDTTAACRRSQIHKLEG